MYYYYILLKSSSHSLIFNVVFYASICALIFNFILFELLPSPTFPQKLNYDVHLIASGFEVKLEVFSRLKISAIFWECLECFTGLINMYILKKAMKPKPQNCLLAGSSSSINGVDYLAFNPIAFCTSIT